MAAAVLALPNTGGTIHVPIGVFSVTALTTISYLDFPSGRVSIVLSEGTVINIGAAAEGFIKFLGEEATPLPYC